MKTSKTNSLNGLNQARIELVEKFGAHLTLGELISELEKLDKSEVINGFSNPHSYRGYYCDLAFVPESYTMTVGELLELCKPCIGKMFYGYKGGEYTMRENTDLQIANKGSCADSVDGFRLIDLVYED